jgi:hypothetical protein
VPHFKFLLDRGVNHLRDCFPSKRVASTETLGLRSTLPDDVCTKCWASSSLPSGRAISRGRPRDLFSIIQHASTKGYLLVASNRRDFLRDAKRYIAQSSKKDRGCCRVSGMILLVPNDEITQRRALKDLEKRLKFEGKGLAIATFMIAI